MGAEESTMEPSSSWNPYPVFPTATVSSTTISALPSVAPAYYVDVPSSSPSIPYPNACPGGIWAQSPPMPVTTINNEPSIWAPSSGLIDFPQGNSYPHYTQVTEQQHLDANPAQFSNGGFGAVLPQEEGDHVVPRQFLGRSTIFQQGSITLGSSPDSVAYANASNAPDSATDSQPYGHQYAPQDINSVPRGLFRFRSL